MQVKMFLAENTEMITDSFKAQAKRRHVSVRDRASNRMLLARNWNVENGGSQYRALNPGQGRFTLRRWSDFQLGDHLLTPRSLHVVGYTHHGLYVGNNNVIHYEGWNTQYVSGPVCMTTLDDFADGACILVQEHSGYGKVRRQCAVRRAKKMLGERKYSLLKRNCEHFVHECISQKSRSPQIDRLKNRMRFAVYNGSDVKFEESGVAVNLAVSGNGSRFLRCVRLPKSGNAQPSPIGGFI